MDNIGIREKFGGKTAITVYYAGSDEPDYFDDVLLVHVVRDEVSGAWVRP
jgi:hypothetical protein